MMLKRLLRLMVHKHAAKNKATDASEPKAIAIRTQCKTTAAKSLIRLISFAIVLWFGKVIWLTYTCYWAA